MPFLHRAFLAQMIAVIASENDNGILCIGTLLQSVQHGAKLIINEGDPADAIYFVSIGQVQVELSSGPITLGAGDPR